MYVSQPKIKWPDHEMVVYIKILTYFDLKLLRRGSSTTLNQRNLQKLMTKIFKVKTGIGLELMKNVFKFADVSFNLGISLNVTVAYHLLKVMALKRHLLKVRNYAIKFQHKS